MIPLAKLWTWTGQLFIPLAFAWAVYIRNGLDSAPPADGVLVSRAYAGLVLTLAAATVLSWSFALYVRAARQRQAKVLVPPNTTFEDKKERNRTISWATVAVFTLAVAVALIVFGSGYSKSQVHGWDSMNPLQSGFWSSRAAAHRQNCPSQPCFAVGARLDPSNRPIYGVFEYIPYVTDGGLMVLALAFLSGLMALIRASRELR